MTDDHNAHIDMIRSSGIVLAQLKIRMETAVHLAGVCEREVMDFMLYPVPAKKLSPDLLARAGSITPNETEAKFVTGQAARNWGVDQQTESAQMRIEMGACGVVLKLGAKSAYVVAPSEPQTCIPSCEVAVIDKTTAGDCLNRKFAFGLTMGKTVVERAQFASDAPTLSVTRADAQLSMPTLGEVE